MNIVLRLISEKRRTEYHGLRSIPVDRNASLGNRNHKILIPVENGRKCLGIRIDIERRIYVFIRSHFGNTVLNLYIQRKIVQIAVQGNLRSRILKERYF